MLKKEKKKGRRGGGLSLKTKNTPKKGKIWKSAGVSGVEEECRT